MAGEMYAVPGETLKAIANAIRSKTKSNDLMMVENMASAIDGLNAIYDINVIPAVPNTYIDTINGLERNYADWTSTGFIPVPTDSNYLVVIGQDNQYRAAYDSEFSYITTLSKGNFINMPDGTKYVRFSSATSEFNYNVYPIKV